MADDTGEKIECPACGAVTAVLADKRGKFYLNCECGLQKFNTEKGQAILIRLMQADTDAKENPKKPQETAEKQEKAAPEKPQEEKRGAGLVILGIFGILSGGAWWILKNRAGR